MTVEPIVLTVALVWAAALLLLGGVSMLRSRDVVTASVGLSWLGTVLVGLLAIVAYREERAYYLDAALAVALLSFVGAIATLRYYRRGRAL